MRTPEPTGRDGANPNRTFNPMRFAQPLALWLLLLLPGIAALLYYGQQRRLAFLQRFGDLALLWQSPSRCPWLHKEWLIGMLILVPFVCAMLALGDPRYPLGPSYLRAGSLDVVMVLDVSKSMAAEDYGSGSRLDKARQIARHLLTELRGNRVGIVTYAGVSFRQADLTDDLDALDFILQHWIKVESVSVGGSNLPQAIETGLELFASETAHEKLMLLFSDGGTEQGKLPAALAQAAHHGVRIVAMGLGKEQPSRIPLYDAQRKFQGYLKIDEQVVTSRLDEEVLRHLADATRGTYVRIRSGREWVDVLGRPDVAGMMFVQEEQKIFQPFFLVALLGFAAQTLVTRL